jgi:TolB-like protein
MPFALFRRRRSGHRPADHSGNCVGHRALTPALAVLCAVVTVTGAVLAILNPSRGFAAEGTPKLLLLPIVVHSAEDPDYLREGLSDMLTARFSRIGALELVRPSDPESGTTDLAEALKLGRKADADFVLYGSFTRFGQGASLDVQCSPTDESESRVPLREIFVHSGSIGEIIPDLDELAGKVSRFARGELIVPAAPASDGFGVNRSSGGGSQDLIERIEALEAALTQILEAETDIVDAEDGAVIDAEIGLEAGAESDAEVE